MQESRSVGISGLRWACSIGRLSALIALSLLAGCQNTGSTGEKPEIEPEATPTSVAARQTAFRLRSDFEAPLNADQGWAAATNESATAFADHPFRLRFELESTGSTTEPRQFQLQVRRNQGSWEPLEAENFPQPAKELELNLDKQAREGMVGGPWHFMSGGEEALSWQKIKDVNALRWKASNTPILAMIREEVHWEPVEFAAVLRFPPAGAARAGIVFGYENADNYLRAEIHANEGIHLVAVRAGEPAHLAAKAFNIKRNEWFEVKVTIEGSIVTLEYGDGALVFSEDLGAAIPVSGTGLFVPKGHQVDLQSLLCEGEPHSPRTSIIASASFSHGTPSDDLLNTSSQPFTGGSGISFAETTAAWGGKSGQSEWEFPIVIRRFADGAALNVPGDRFDYRVVDARGRPLPAKTTATVTLDVAPGHLGGTFVETPMRLGPWQAKNGDLYFLMEPAETWNALMTVKSSDGGQSWLEIDGDHRPATGDLEGFASALIGDRIHMVHQTSDDVWYHVFRTSDHTEQPDTWAIRDEWIASPQEPPTQVADLAVRSDGSVVVVFGGPHKIHYAIRSPEGNWSESQVIDAGAEPDLSGPAMTLGQGDVVHLAYTGRDGTAWYRQLSANNTLGARTLVSDGLGRGSEDAGSVLPLVYLPETDTVSILYRRVDGRLWERRVSADGTNWSEAVPVTRRAVAQNTVDSDQTGADAIAHGDTVHCLFVDEASGQLYHTMRRGEAPWTQPQRCGKDQPVQWVRGAVVKRANAELDYGYVIDAGSFGGSGMNRYREQPLSFE